MNYLKWNKISGCLVFGIALIAYIATAQQTVMFWDSGEFIASSYKIQATHPPGAPLYTLLSRLFVMFFPATSVAFASAIFSALCGAFTVWFLYHATIWLGQKIGERLSLDGEGFDIALIGASAIASLSLTFSDSFWVSSTEAEVYTLSTLFMAWAFWAITRWERDYGKSGNDRWLLLVVFVFGLSIGVHILNLAILFPAMMLISLKKFGLNLKSVVIALGGALLLFIVFNSFLVQGLIKLLIRLEIMAVNSFGWSQHSGAMLGILLFLVLITGVIIWSRLKGKYLFEKLAVGLLLFTVGWSTYVTAVIRTDANTPTSNNAYDVLRLLDYMRSEQFGFNNLPLFFGPTFNSPRDGDKEFVDTDPVRVYDEKQKKYVVSNDGKLQKANYHKDGIMLFPRMYSFEAIDIQGYQQWVDYEGHEISAQIRGADGQLRNVVVPTMGENLSFFFRYQLGWLNYRYLMWNYAGRQNDIKGIGIPSAANWVSGISLFDNARIGSPQNVPEFYEENKAKNEFYMLPLILGLMGLFFLFKSARQEFFVSLLFFLAFGVAITIFINQRPIHILIRERDYIFLGSYYVFSMWIGIGVLALYYWLREAFPLPSRRALLAAGIGLIIPMLMAFKGWDDHDRSNDHVAYNLAKNTLAQCESNSVLISLGDNISFPMWYLQEVEGFRTDVRVLEYTLMNLHWYIDRTRTAVNKSPALKMSLPREFYRKGESLLFPLRKNPNIKQHTDIKQVIKYVTSLKKDRHIPTDLFSLALPQASLQEVLAYQGTAEPQFRWQFSKPQFSMQDVVLLDLIAQNASERTFHFTNPQLGLENHLLNKGLVKELVPISPQSTELDSELIDDNAMYQLLMYDMDFKSFSDTNRFVSAMNYDFANNVYRPAFNKLANSLLNKGKVLKTKEVLDRLQQVFPNSNVPYREQMFEAAKLYHQLGYFGEWQTITKMVMYNLMGELNWYTSFYSKNKIITYDAATKLGEKLSNLMTEIGQRDNQLIQEFEPQLDELKNQYNTWILENPVISKRHLK